METLLNEIAEIESDNLFKIVKTLIGIDAEHHWLTEKELRAEQTKDRLIRILFYDDLIGNVMIIPHNSLKARVAVWVQPLLPNKTYKTDLADDESLESVALGRMRRLAAGIRKELSLGDQMIEEKQKLSGRHHYPDDIWAWEQIYKYDQDPKEVEKKWRERIGVKNRHLEELTLIRQFKRINHPDYIRTKMTNMH